MRLWCAERNNWEEILLIEGYTQNSRGLGVADMADAIQSSRSHPANERLVYHVLDIMHCMILCRKVSKSRLIAYASDLHLFWVYFLLRRSRDIFTEILKIKEKDYPKVVFFSSPKGDSALQRERRDSNPRSRP